MVKLNCKQCGADIFKYPSQIKGGEGKFCSKECYTKSMQGVDILKDVRWVKPKGKRYDIVCSYCGDIFSVVPSVKNTAKFCSKDCYDKAHKVAVKNVRQLRNTTEYKEWRLAVYKRDGFTCQSCGNIGRNLNAHHIIPIAKDVTKMLDINNGITLCKDCHILAHKKYKPKCKGGELLENLYEIISSQAESGMIRKVQRLGVESRTDSNTPTSAVHESDDIV